MKVKIYNREQHKGYNESCEMLKILHKDSDIVNIEVYPDIAFKSLGFPNGTLLQSKKHIYPFAVPDPGCGYRIILTNLLLKDVQHLKKQLLYDLLDTQGRYELFRQKEFSKIDFEQVINKGVYYFKNIDYILDLPQPINMLKIDLSDCDKYELFDFFGIPGSPFLEFRYSDRDIKVNELEIRKGQIFIIIHLGTIVGKKLLNRKFLENAINNTLNENIYSFEEIQKYFMYIDVESEIGEQYLDFINFMIHFAYCSREISTSILKNCLEDILNFKVEFKILSDLTHSSIKVRGGLISHARGLQYISNIEKPILIGGNTNSKSILAYPINNNSFISHGTGIYYSKDSSNDEMITFTNREYECDIKKECEDVEMSLQGIKNDFRTICELEPFLNFWNEK
ncbi:hypothetical protein F6O75_00775 [Streptococcus suis]|uniref:3'-phosphate/5'-hydroxy nucleic acid ligase n=2 Tax=Streptococcus suis TaxID=1307 RepID=A0A1X9I2Q5_STRSU|nr:RtcB family protein [Streptococcus suis]AER15036.1 protein of unknown function UPF0027 [Streptococcus suis SS12]ANJ64222.1 hypothetical protein [Streptococcus suis]MBL1188971.1 hypothetical protein [Streptococcus suis]MBL1190959.1 hypothetical protein [Streptococcus suis]MBP0925834.1 RtcB family protein [Streptococcus suis]